MATEKKTRGPQKKRQHGPVPIPIVTDSISPYRRKFTSHELRDLLNNVTFLTTFLTDNAVMPTKLWNDLREFVVGQITANVEELNKIRHDMMDAAIDEVGRDEAGITVAKRLGHEHKASTMWRSYWIIERSLPPEQRRSKRPKRHPKPRRR